MRVKEMMATARRCYAESVPVTWVSSQPCRGALMTITGRIEELARVKMIIGGYRIAPVVGDSLFETPASFVPIWMRKKPKKGAQT